jgi:hypothetical protein
VLSLSLSYHLKGSSFLAFQITESLWTAHRRRILARSKRQASLERKGCCLAGKFSHVKLCQWSSVEGPQSHTVSLATALIQLDLSGAETKKHSLGSFAVRSPEGSSKNFYVYEADPLLAN